jgi:hypothetical protein
LRRSSHGGQEKISLRLASLWCEEEEEEAHMLKSSVESFIGRASIVSRKWREGMRQALACRVKLSFAGSRADDSAVGYMVEGAWSLRELNM